MRKQSVRGDDIERRLQLFGGFVGSEERKADSAKENAGAANRFHNRNIWRFLDFARNDKAVQRRAVSVARFPAVIDPPLQHHLLSWDGPAGAFFLSPPFTPIFFRNGSTDCLRPRNFSIETVTSRPSPCS